MIGQQSLLNFYVSVEFSYPALAEQMSEDISIAGLYALGADKTMGQDAVERLRERAMILPEVHRRVLESALGELGYS